MPQLDNKEIIEENDDDDDWKPAPDIWDMYF